MQALAIIPSRYASTRFPGKPLATIQNKPIIEWAYSNAKKALEHVVVATDDERIFNAVRKFGGNVVITDVNHQSGTDRCAEAANIYSEQHKFTPDIVLNIQGDEPFVQPEQLELILSCFEDKNTEIATLVKKIENIEDVLNPNAVKAVLGKTGQALYFSRSPIPYVRDFAKEDWLNRQTFYKHLGMYAYTYDALKQITKLPKGNLEKAESLEQLRWLENGFFIKVKETTLETIGVDTLEDLEKAKQFAERNFNLK